jgi:exodeoxyribonuclease-3
MKIVSWNINSLRLRLPLLKKFIDNNSPDIICLQEIKVSNDDFPMAEVRSLGFDFVEFDGEKSYNGVAIFSKYPIKKVEKIDVLNYGHKRHIFAQIKTPIDEINLHNFYVPAGGDIPDVALNNKFDHKLKFVDWMSEYFIKNSLPKTIILGDFNIAPKPQDVWSHKQLLKVVSHTPIEVEKLEKLQKSLDFVDAHRFLAGEDLKLYSWWSYRAMEPLQSDRGRRLDHIWITPDLKLSLKNAKIYRDFRLENSPSDHVPIEILI